MWFYTTEECQKVYELLALISKGQEQSQEKADQSNDLLATSSSNSINSNMKSVFNEEFKYFEQLFEEE